MRLWNTIQNFWQEAKDFAKGVLSGQAGGASYHRPSAASGRVQGQSRALPDAIDIHGVKELPLYTVRASLKPLFKDPHLKSGPLQIRTAKILLGTLGIAKLPGLLIESLESLDAFAAVDRLLLNLGLAFRSLLENKELRQLAYLRVNALVEAEEYLRQGHMDEEELFRQIRGLELGQEQDFEWRMQQYILMQEKVSGIEFFLAEAKDLEEAFWNDWQYVEKAELEDLVEALLEHIAFHQAVYDLIAEVKDCIAAIAPLVSGTEDEEDFLLEVSVFDHFVQDMEKGTIDDATIAGFLEECHQRFVTWWEQLQDEEEDTRNYDQQKITEEAIKKALAVLGLSFPGDFNHDTIKKAYRILVKKYHTDLKNNPHASKDRMQQLNAARDFLYKNL